MKKSSLSAWLLWCASLIFYIFMAAVQMPAAAEKLTTASQDNSCVEVLDLKVGGFTKEEALKSLGCMGVDGRKAYFNIETTTDIIYPVSYGLFFAISAYFLVLYTTGRMRLAVFFAIIPILGMLMDFYENRNLAILILQYPSLDSSTVQLASVGNIFKWVFFFVALASTLIFSVMALLKKLRNRS